MVIKVKEDMKPWQVMKTADEGGRVVYRYRKGAGRVSGWNKMGDIEPVWNWEENNYAIIDDT